MILGYKINGQLQGEIGASTGCLRRKGAAGRLFRHPKPLPTTLLPGTCRDVRPDPGFVPTAQDRDFVVFIRKFIATQYQDIFYTNNRGFCRSAWRVVSRHSSPTKSDTKRLLCTFWGQDEDTVASRGRNSQPTGLLRGTDGGCSCLHSEWQAFEKGVVTKRNYHSYGEIMILARAGGRPLIVSTGLYGLRILDHHLWPSGKMPCARFDTRPS